MFRNTRSNDEQLEVTRRIFAERKKYRCLHVGSCTLIEPKPILSEHTKKCSTYFFVCRSNFFQALFRTLILRIFKQTLSFPIAIRFRVSIIYCASFHYTHEIYHGRSTRWHQVFRVKIARYQEKWDNIFPIL